MNEAGQHPICVCVCILYEYLSNILYIVSVCVYRMALDCCGIDKERNNACLLWFVTSQLPQRVSADTRIHTHILMYILTRFYCFGCLGAVLLHVRNAVHKHEFNKHTHIKIHNVQSCFTIKKKCQLKFSYVEPRDRFSIPFLSWLNV